MSFPLVPSAARLGRWGMFCGGIDCIVLFHLVFTVHRVSLRDGYAVHVPFSVIGLYFPYPSLSQLKQSRQHHPLIILPFSRPPPPALLFFLTLQFPSLYSQFQSPFIHHKPSKWSRLVSSIFPCSRAEHIVLLLPLPAHFIGYPAIGRGPWVSTFEHLWSCDRPIGWPPYFVKLSTVCPSSWGL